MAAVAPHPSTEIAGIIAAHLPVWAGRRPFVLGIAGAQGLGKSSVARLLAERFACPTLSLDDLYLDRAARAELAARVHPLLATRGAPGTHDVALGLTTIEALGDGPALLPRYDKARDAPAAPERWPERADMLVLEGWCLGARAQPEAALAAPVNALEAEADPEAACRRWTNAQLAGPYARLFNRIDMLAFLAAPGFPIVPKWRIEQERAIGGPMTDAEVHGFVAHYQRLTEWMLRDLPGRADLTIRFDTDRRVVGVTRAGAGEPR